MTRHNKKRNTGLLYEFLVRSISDAIVEGNDNKRNLVVNILKKHFVPGTELYKEFRLFHSLVATTVNSPSVADAILGAAKQASQTCNEEKLNHEKSLLIKSINHTINDGDFYKRRIPEYKTYATIQTLLNEWRNNSFNDIVKTAEYEGSLREWLLKDKNVITLDEEAIKNSDPLVEKLMIKKINERYKNTLSEEQSTLIRKYIAAKNDDELSQLGERLENIKNRALNNIDNYLKENNGKDKYLEEKLSKAKDLILKEDLNKVDDEKIGRFLDVAKLDEELKER